MASELQEEGPKGSYSPLMKVLRWIFVLLLVSLLVGAMFWGGSSLLTSQAKEVLEGWESHLWPAVPAKVERSAAVYKYAPSPTKHGGMGTHVVETRYTFEVADKVYSGRRKSLDAEGKILTGEGAQNVARRLPAGSTVTAFYDPADPTRSLLEPGVPVDGVIGTILGALLIAGGIVLLVFTARLATRRRA